MVACRLDVCSRVARRALLTLALAWIGAASVAGADASATALTWSAPATIDHQPPFAAPAFFTSISCPSSSFCAATQGGVLTSANPRGDDRSWHAATIAAASAGAVGTTLAISCPSAALCTAVTSSGFAVSSRAPAGSAPWTATEIDPSNVLSAISCPSGALCVAVDQAGNAVTTTDPAGPARGWTVRAIDPGHSLVAVSCPSAALCVALDSAGRVLTTMHPRGPAGGWSVARIDSDDNALTSVSCPSAALCVAADMAGNAITSTRPTGGAGAWTRTNVMFAGASFIPGPTVSCAGGLCVIARLNTVVHSTHPTGRASSWSAVTLSADQGFISGLSCPSRAFCAAVDQTGGTPGFPPAYSGGDAITTTSPTGPDDRWLIRQVDGTNGVVNVSCSAATFCIAGNDAGDVLTSPAPARGPAAWTLAHIDPHLSGGGPGPAGAPSERGVACFGASGCVAGDDSGNLFSTSSPGLGASAWRAFSGVGDYFEAFMSASCPTAAQCDVVSSNGDLAAVNPASPTPPRLALIDPARGLSAISCPSESLCVAVDVTGNVLTSTDAGAGPSAWSSAAIDPGHALSGLSCPSVSLCVAVDAAGGVLISTHPTGGAGSWTRRAIDPEHVLTSVSCATSSLCVAVDDAGHALVATAPVSGSWASTTIDPQRSLHAVSCSRAATCVASDSAGQVLVATPSGTGARTARQRAHRRARRVSRSR